MTYERTRSMYFSIRELVVPAQELEKQGKEVLKLNIGDPCAYDFDTPDFVKEAAIKAIKEGKNHYAPSDGFPGLRQAIVKREKRVKDIRLKTENILPTLGASEGINMLFGSFIEAGDEVLMPDPCYPQYPLMTDYYDGKSVYYKCTEEEGWQPSIEDIKNKISDKTKLLITINPNNPTGALYSRETLKEIADIAAEQKIPVITDEIYDQLTFDKKFESIASLNDEASFIIIGGLSKVYFAPGWRTAYMAFKSPNGELDELRESCLKMCRLRLSSNTPCQLAMKAAMEGPEDFLRENIKKLRERRDFAVKRINEIEGLSVTKPEAAFYMFPKIEVEAGKNDREFVLDLLYKKHVLVVNGSSFGKENGSSHFRMVFLPPVEVLGKALDKIEEFLKESS